MIYVRSVLLGLVTAFAAAALWMGGEILLVDHKASTAPRIAETPPPMRPTSAEFTVTTNDEIVGVDVVVTRPYWALASLVGFALGFYWMFRRQLVRRSRHRVPW